MSFKILVVDDDKLSLDVVKEKLKFLIDIELQTTTDPVLAARIIKADPFGFAVILLDLQMPDKSGVTLAKEMIEINPHLILVGHSGDNTRQALKDCMAAGIQDFLEKDMAPEEFREKIKSLCKKFETTSQVFQNPGPDELSELIRSVGMIGCSEESASIAKQMISLSKASCNVLIHGESGTGKELVASGIHRLSNRKNGLFVPINMSAIPDNLVESDLFGHERGAFTGADKNKIGKFMLANGGTIFLDEIGELKPELQAKLLRVLQEGEISPVGSIKSIKVDVRIIAATHVNLEKAVEAGKFREDLYYRLNVVKVSVPPLRERPKDILPLVSHFQKIYDGMDKTILMSTIRYLERYPWKGNVRELENEMERLMTVVGAKRIEPTHLSSKFFTFRQESSESNYDCTFETFMNQLKDQEVKYYKYHLNKARSLREAVTFQMQAPLGTVYARMKKLGLKGEVNEEVV